MAIEQRHSTSSGDNYTPLSLKTTRKNEDRPWKLRLIYLQCYLISIACILGTGILGLPGTVAHAGLQPFLVSFIVGFFMQVLLIYFFVDLLQRCRLVQVEAAKHLMVERIIMQDVSGQDSLPSSIEDEEETEDADHVLLHQNNGIDHFEEEQMPNLHILGALFLNKYMSYVFDLLLILQFISIGISYVLAGSEAFAELLQIRHVYVIPFFTWILSFGIILAQVIIQPITSILTLAKGTMLIITVIVTFVVGSEIHQEIFNDFCNIGTPFLMGTVALGGIVNVMPMLFSEISQNRSQIMWFRRSVTGGLTTCAILNILWCWAVLDIVPQTSARKVLFDGDLNTSAFAAHHVVPGYIMTYSNISLEASEKAGEIATIPLTKIIMEQYKRFAWVAWFTEIFITVSITVSFLVLGSAMKHTLEGWVDSFWNEKCETAAERCEKSCYQLIKISGAKSLTQGLICLLGFGIIFLVAMSNPKGFVVALDKVTSFALNLEAGLFIFLMLRNSRSEPYKLITVPLPMSSRIFFLHWLLPIYFLFAVGYDIYQTLSRGWYHSNSLSGNGTV
ncbi:uncharacterized protein si:ch211-51h4.2 isoform X1 [Stegostoma tigrinum]|uniref:uncharacterized protein si:ch211-51h4.2 isoform X1 n=3 Tax=Stegostoma tigrinum TaxID=3053191 RepID=UPI00202ADCA8|nr:uncharacterized protein si:ch211-51h4.2 isoform X1 [Stegostoma tigrinum]